MPIWRLVWTSLLLERLREWPGLVGIQQSERDGNHRGLLLRGKFRPNGSKEGKLLATNSDEKLAQTIADNLRREGNKTIIDSRRGNRARRLSKIKRKWTRGGYCRKKM